MGRKAKRARVLARIERLLGSQEETTQQPSVVSNSEMQEKLKEVQKVQEKVKKHLQELFEKLPILVLETVIHLLDFASIYMQK